MSFQNRNMNVDLLLVLLKQTSKVYTEKMDLPVCSIQNRPAVNQNKLLLQTTMKLYSRPTLILWPLNSPNTEVLLKK